MKKTITVFLLMLLMLLASCGSNDMPAASDGNVPVTDNDSAQARREEMWKYRDDDNVGQILYVTHTEGNNAVAEFYEKHRDENNVWVLVFRTDAFIGVDQMGDHYRNSGRTPLGDYGIGNAFGIRSNPGTKLNYIDITPTTYACDEDTEYYNQIIDTKETGHDCKGEEMYKYSPEYNYGLQTDTNPANEYDRDSNLFIHCKGAKPFTMGCVALDEEYMVTVLKKAGPGMRVYYSEMYVQQ